VTGGCRCGLYCPEDVGVCADRLQIITFHRVLQFDRYKYGRRRPEADWYVRWANRGVQLLPTWMVGLESHTQKFFGVCTFVVRQSREASWITGRNSM